MLLGLDIGTQSVKALLYDEQRGTTVAVHSAALDLISKDDGTREQSAQWWLEALRKCLTEMEPRHKAAVEAIGVSGQQHGFVALDKNGAVLRPVKLWCDTATTTECAEIMDAFGGSERAIEEVGNAILPGYTAAKIRWLKNHHRDIYRRLHTVLLPHDYVNYYLSGELAMEVGDASGTGLLDIRSRDWHAGMLRAVDSERDLLDCLPRLVQPTHAMGRLRESVARELGLAPGIPLAAGGGDNMMAALGTGNVVSGRLTVSLGTSGTLFAYSDTPVIDPRGRLAAFCSSTGGWLPLLCTMNCTVATELTRRLLGVDLTATEGLVSQSAVGAQGVVTLPFFSGERSPNLPNGKGCILGLDDQNYTAANLLRSAMEAATFALRSGRDAFSELGCAVQEIRLTGGGARSATWRQMVSDVFNLPVIVLKSDEGAALGAALQALWMQQSGSDLRGLVDEHVQRDEARSCMPHTSGVEQYEIAYERYRDHVEQLTPLYS